MYPQYVFCAYRVGQTHMFTLPVFMPRVSKNGAIPYTGIQIRIFSIRDTYLAITHDIDELVAL